MLLKVSRLRVLVLCEHVELALVKSSYMEKGRETRVEMKKKV